jgi:hypothetical protein
MTFLFADEAFSFETLRTAGFAAYGGADIGEQASASGHRVCARETLLRASNHYRTISTGEHTHAGALARAHQTRFDWLATTLIAVR